MIVVVTVSVALAVLVVLTHYEVLRALSVLLPHLRVRPRFRMVFVILGALAGHVLEMWIFAFGFFFLCPHKDFGLKRLNQAQIGGKFGLSGLVLIAWTASFTYLQMQRLWTDA